ncbi:unknown transmembrane protein [Mesoplasma florum L1]|uniref:Uncharacterized protein n=1 Tax=Mesoplasma florum (strain ATCC 33453 / NBRC 100688 / NCTC 11704 / L1) TaxID=265311 RepID=Q6F209_MESFL|nr:MG406 family protein [Mesoplasma florum]AAT75464.1 unknown transmembrane protein [Mesoplasma florum L1]ATI73065.1 hypothetical protein CQZ69_00565 [Mesoplasma florum]AVN61468.1 hypothetical protein CG004_00565 [Mesoplasma florum]
MELKSIYKNWFKNSTWSIILIISFLTGITLILLFVLKIINYSWLTGWALGLTSFLVGIFISKKSVELLLKNENHFLFYFFFLLRIGAYATPLFIAFFNNNIIFDYKGVLIGLSPILLLPFTNHKVLNIKNY